VNSLIILGSMEDSHVSRVVNRLSHFDIFPICVDPFDSNAMTLDMVGGEMPYPVTLKVEGQADVSIDERCVVWFRNKRAFFAQPECEEEQIKYFMLSEQKSFFLSLVDLTGIRSFNSVPAALRHQRKPQQLHLAKSIGLEIPPTIICSDYDKIISFSEQHGDSLIKPLLMQNIPGKTEKDVFAVHSYMVTAEELRNYSREDVESAPFIMQQYVQKAYELRIMVFDDTWHAYKIDSQDSINGKIDWRLANHEDIFSSIDISPQFGRKLVKYLRESGLTYGSFDFIVTPKGEHVFLECNSDGQWAWLEYPDKGDTPITDTISTKIRHMLEDDSSFRWAS